MKLSTLTYRVMIMCADYHVFFAW